MARYDRYIGSPYEGTFSTILLLNSSTQSYSFTENEVYTDLPDNVDKLIVPKKIRNAIISTYETMPFKENLVGDKYYIGIGDNEQNLKSPIFIGKRFLYGSEFIDGGIISSNDITIYNTKADTSTRQGNTSMVFLAGTNSTLHLSAPRISTDEIKNETGTERLDISLSNPNGDIKILSKGSNPGDGGATVSINGIQYPKIQSTDPTMGGDSGDGKVLSYQNGAMIWDDLSLVDPGYYGATDSITPIFGDPIMINGYSLDFTDDRFCPIDIGDINYGDNFDSIGISEMLERIVYDYLPPICTLSLSGGVERYSEIGSRPEVYLDYSITKRTNDTKPTALYNMIPNQLPAISSSTTLTRKGKVKGVVILPLEKRRTTFTITASDGTSSNSVSTFIEGIYPFFYGFTASTTVNNTLLTFLNKKVVEVKDIGIDIYRSGIDSSDYFYFMYDYDYGPLSAILDPSGSDILSGRFLPPTESTLSSPDGYWAGKKMRVYISTSISGLYTPPGSISAYFTFVF